MRWPPAFTRLYRLFTRCIAPRYGQANQHYYYSLRPADTTTIRLDFNETKSVVSLSIHAPVPRAGPADTFTYIEVYLLRAEGPRA